MLMFMCKIHVHGPMSHYVGAGEWRALCWLLAKQQQPTWLSRVLFSVKVRCGGAYKQKQKKHPQKQATDHDHGQFAI